MKATWRTGPWIFSARIDLLAFGGSAALSGLLLLLGAWQGWLHSDSPEWTWVTCVLAVDVAHVWSTAFRAYFEPSEWNRRSGLLIAVPIAAAVLGYSLYAQNPDWFWRCLAYLAVWHFLRQQQGWVAWYRRKGNEPGGWELAIDRFAIYSAMIYPLIYWHSHLPRDFHWFIEGDFGGIPRIVNSFAWPLYLTALSAYAIKSLRDWTRGTPRLGKDLVVLTTAVCWYVGIVSFNSDYAFTVTNVLIHGIPYLVLILWYRAQRLDSKPLDTKPLDAKSSTAMPLESPTTPIVPPTGLQPTPQPHSNSMLVSESLVLDDSPDDWAAPATAAARRPPSLWRILFMILATVWLAAYLEELLWDRFVWHERAWLFGDSEPGADIISFTPLLALPQITHYVLDGFLWRRRDLVVNRA